MKMVMIAYGDKKGGKMGSFMTVMKEDKGARFIFVILGAMIILGIACVVFVLLNPQ